MGGSAQVVLEWLRRLVALDMRVFEDIRAEPAATIPALIVAAASIFLSGIGGWLWWMARPYANDGDILVNSAVIGSLLAMALWAAWVGVVYFVLRQFYRERLYLEQLLRVMGLALAPLALTLLMFLPALIGNSLAGLSLGIGLAVIALTFGLSHIAIQSATTADQSRVLVANLAGFLLWAGVLSLMVSWSATQANAYAPGVFLYHAPADAIDLDLSPADQPPVVGSR